MAERLAIRTLIVLLIIRALFAAGIVDAASTDPTWYLDGRGIALSELWCSDSAGSLTVLTIVRRSMVNTSDPESLVCYGHGHRYVSADVDDRSMTITLARADYRLVIPIIVFALPY